MFMFGGVVIIFSSLIITSSEYWIFQNRVAFIFKLNNKSFLVLAGAFVSSIDSPTFEGDSEVTNHLTFISVALAEDEGWP